MGSGTKAFVGLRPDTLSLKGLYSRNRARPPIHAQDRTYASLTLFAGDGLSLRCCGDLNQRERIDPQFEV
jgi:hypothetical protein